MTSEEAPMTISDQVDAAPLVTNNIVSNNENYDYDNNEEDDIDDGYNLHAAQSLQMSQISIHNIDDNCTPTNRFKL